MFPITKTDEITRKSVGLCQGHLRDLGLRLPHFVGDYTPVHVHGCADVRVPHQPLLHRDRGAHRIEPTPVGVSQAVGAKLRNTRIFCGPLKFSPVTFTETAGPSRTSTVRFSSRKPTRVTVNV